MRFEIGPEAFAQQVGQGFQTVVVQSGLAFLEVFDEEISHRVAPCGEARPSTPEELAAYLTGEQQHWTRIVEAAKMSIE